MEIELCLQNRILQNCQLHKCAFMRGSCHDGSWELGSAVKKFVNSLTVPPCQLPASSMHRKFRYCTITLTLSGNRSLESRIVVVYEDDDDLRCGVVKREAKKHIVKTPLESRGRSYCRMGCRNGSRRKS